MVDVDLTKCAREKSDELFFEHVRLRSRFRLRFGWLIELQIVKAPIVAGFFEQLGVRADFLDSAMIEDNDLIGGQNRRETMRDRDYGPAGRQFLERFLNLFFRFSIE